MKLRTNGKRGGVALVIAVIALAVVAVMLTAVTWQTLAQQRFLAQRERQLQAYYLGQTGIEHAAARLLADPKYTGETLKPFLDAEVLIQVKPLQGDVFQIFGEARFPAGDPQAVVRTAERGYRLLDGRLTPERDSSTKGTKEREVDPRNSTK